MASILNNVSALQATRQLGITTAGMKQTIERLTTGKQINHASDDAAGLANANKFLANAKVAHEQKKTENQNYYAAAANDGFLDEATNLVMRAMQLAAGGNSTSAEMTSVSSLALAAALKAGVTLTTMTDTGTASTAMGAIDTARSAIAATMATAQSNANLDGITEENMTSQDSNIRDADIGTEVVNLTKFQILSQAGNSALSNANQASQYVLALLR